MAASRGSTLSRGDARTRDASVHLPAEFGARGVCRSGGWSGSAGGVYAVRLLVVVFGKGRYVRVAAFRVCPAVPLVSSSSGS